MSSGTGTCGRNRSLMLREIVIHRIIGLRLGEVGLRFIDIIVKLKIVRERMGV
jgi:hypothetical protein